MKRIFHFLLIAIAAGMLSCEDYLNTLPGDKYDDATIWQNTNLIDSYVFGIYKGVPYPFNWYVSASMVDEAVPIQDDGVMTRVLTSTMT
ncbi:MAG: SusD-like protein, partial [Bacteroidetes bacterium]|nr:SusD-like protein [Bacteroidota bacterium]